MSGVSLSTLRHLSLRPYEQHKSKIRNGTSLSKIIRLIDSILNQNDMFQWLSQENESFGQSMLAVRIVLIGIRETGRLQDMSEPLDLIHQAAEMGREVRQVSTERSNLRTFLFRQAHIAKLNAATAMMKQAMIMIASRKVVLDDNMQRALDDTRATLRRTRSLLRDCEIDVSRTIRNEVIPGLQHLSREVIESLQEIHVVSHRQDCIEQLRKIHIEAWGGDLVERLYLDERLLTSVLAPPLPPQMTKRIEHQLTCPISHEFMSDPVILSPSGKTFDRRSLCTWLLRSLRFNETPRCPWTNQPLGTNMTYVDDINTRDTLTHYLGEEAYQRYDDSEVRWRYATLPPQMSPRIRRKLTCPISRNFMRDPVVLTPSGTTCDRESFCKALLEKPARCPLTNQPLGEKLSYVENHDTRDTLIHYRGEGAYEPFDDTDFLRQYNAFWDDPEVLRNVNSNADLTEKKGAKPEEFHCRVIQFGITIVLTEFIAVGFSEACSVHNKSIVVFATVILYYTFTLCVSHLYRPKRRRSNDFSAYKHVSSYLYGMNQTQIDWLEAQKIVMNTGHKDAIIVGLKALLLHPDLYNGTSSLYKDEDKSILDWARAVQLGLFDEVAAGNAWAQWLKGLHCDVVEHNFLLARYFYELAAEQDHPLALNNLGVLYEKGDGLAMDYTTAREYRSRAENYYTRSANQGNALAQFNLGLFHEPDYNTVRHFLEQAEAQGHVDASFELGDLYLQGEVVGQDLRKARQYFQRAFERVHVTAHSYLVVFINKENACKQLIEKISARR